MKLYEISNYTTGPRTIYLELLLLSSLLSLACGVYLLGDLFLQSSQAPAAFGLSVNISSENESNQVKERN